MRSILGKKLRKKELLNEIALEREKLEAILLNLPVRTLSKKGINDANWSIKDILTHLNEWEERVVHWYQLSKSGVEPMVPDSKYSWKQIRDLNHWIQKRHCRKSVRQVLDEFEAIHRQTLEVVAKMTDKELVSLQYFNWTGKSWTLSDYLRANTASHYRWARTRIRSWLKHLNEQTSK